MLKYGVSGPRIDARLSRQLTSGLVGLPTKVSSLQLTDKNAMILEGTKCVRG